MSDDAGREKERRMGLRWARFNQQHVPTRIFRQTVREDGTCVRCICEWVSSVQRKNLETHPPPTITKSYVVFAKAVNELEIIATEGRGRVRKAQSAAVERNLPI